MKKIDFLKAGKIALGCCIGYFIAESFQLMYSTSVITITLLSILNTRKETFHTAWKRLLAFCIAVLTGVLFFPALNYNILSLLFYLFLYYIICQILQVTEGFSMSTVLMLHLWNAGTFAFPSILNEFYLMLIGITMGIFMNVYMPNRITRIRIAQKDIERQISEILRLMSKAIFYDQKDERISDALEILNSTLLEALSHATYTEQNFVLKDMSYYSIYIKMRISQYELLKRIHCHLPRLREPYYQTELVSDFMVSTANSMDEYNNAEDLLDELQIMRKKFKSTPLPRSRTEFESRAVLYEIVNELHELLLAKKHFADHLTPYQIQTFWQYKKEY